MAADEKPTPDPAPRRTYPVTGPWAVLARAGLIAALAAIAYASLTPGRYVPHLIYSYHLEHFAAFYVATLIALAAIPGTKLRWIAYGMVCLGLFMETGRLFDHRGLVDSYLNFVADTGGALSALLPIAVDRFRRMLRPGGPT